MYIEVISCIQYVQKSRNYKTIIMNKEGFNGFDDPGLKENDPLIRSGEEESEIIETTSLEVF